MIVDCFQYFNEREVMALRIKYLSDFVDGFIICEANRTFKGELKEFTCAEDLKAFDVPTDKVQIIQLEAPSAEEQPDPWFRERLQRDVLVEAMKRLPGENFFIVSDCDEIISKEGLFRAVEHLKLTETEILWFSLRFLIGRADTQVYVNSKPFNWNNPYIITSNLLNKNKTLSDFRAEENKKTLGYLSDGWHLSWMGDGERRVRKLNSFAHCFDSIPTCPAPLYSEKMKDYVKNYKPGINSNDPIGRVDHVLHHYPEKFLPSTLLDDERLVRFFLP